LLEGSTPVEMVVTFQSAAKTIRRHGGDHRKSADQRRALSLRAPAGIRYDRELPLTVPRMR